jgi:hypothetical protein
MAVSVLTGTFAFRFQGHCIFQNNGGPVLTLSEVGLGTMIIKSDGAILGRQDSIATPVGINQMPQGYPLFCRYQLVGRYLPDPGGVTGTAEIQFTPSNDCPGCGALSASFSIVRAGPKRFWIISRHASTATTNAAGKAVTVTVDEVCSGEAIKIEDLAEVDLKLPPVTGTPFQSVAADPGDKAT